MFSISWKKALPSISRIKLLIFSITDSISFFRSSSVETRGSVLKITHVESENDLNVKILLFCFSEICIFPLFHLGTLQNRNTPNSQQISSSFLLCNKNKPIVIGIHQGVCNKSKYFQKYG